MKVIQKAALVLAATIAAAVGCNSADERLVAVSEKSAARQAEQNQHLARQSQQVAEAVQMLVEADSKARGELLGAQRSLEHGLQIERSNLDRRQEDLEQARRALATAREREPLIASAIVQAATLLGCLLPIVVCLYLLRALDRPASDDELSELLLQEIIAANSPLLLAPDDPYSANAGPDVRSLPHIDEPK